MCMVLLLQADVCTYVIEVGLFVKCQWAIYLITNYDMEFRNKIHSSMYGIDSETQFFLTLWKLLSYGDLVGSSYEVDSN